MRFAYIWMVTWSTKVTKLKVLLVSRVKKCKYIFGPPFHHLVLGTGLICDMLSAKAGVARWLVSIEPGDNWQAVRQTGSWWSQLGSWASFWKNHLYWMMIISTTRDKLELTLMSIGSLTPSQSHIYTHL